MRGGGTSSSFLQQIYPHIIANTLYKEEPSLALLCDFFAGVIEYDSEYRTSKRVVYPPAYTITKALERKKDDNFCKYCLLYKRHAFKCKNSGWLDFM